MDYIIYFRFTYFSFVISSALGNNTDNTFFLSIDHLDILDSDKRLISIVC